MIPSDVISRLQGTQEVTLRPVTPTPEITDKLSEFTAGQRLMAEIQALLPNGTYRAMINQRSITLALPFAARSGDALELEVTESDGKLALAVLSHQKGGEGKEAVSATLSRTAQLISQLFSGAKNAGNEGKALPLNGNQPLARTPPGNAQDILPLLKEAIARSGMFYESHQAEWIEGRFAKAELLQEPQGRLSSQTAPPGTENSAGSALFRAIVLTSTPTGQPAPPSGQTAPPSARTAADPASTTSTSTAAQKAGETSAQAGQIVAPQVQGIVHQQLDALANQTFVWQGQVWPGQDMRWEIEEDGQNNRDDDPEALSWRTSLDLSFPVLGGISAKLQLRGNRVALALDVDDEVSLGLMRAASETLRQRLEDAGLTLESLGFARSVERKAP